jgi:putative FmdB family regulatory protein
MPLYEFVCDECGQAFELLVGFSQTSEPQTCPGCGGAQTHRKMSSFAVGGSSSGTPAMSAAPARSPFT